MSACWAYCCEVFDVNLRKTYSLTINVTEQEGVLEYMIPCMYHFLDEVQTPNLSPRNAGLIMMMSYIRVYTRHSHTLLKLSRSITACDCNM